MSQAAGVLQNACTDFAAIDFASRSTAVIGSTPAGCFPSRSFFPHKGKVERSISTISSEMYFTDHILRRSIIPLVLMTRSLINLIAMAST